MSQSDSDIEILEEESTVRERDPSPVGVRQLLILQHAPETDGSEFSCAVTHSTGAAQMVVYTEPFTYRAPETSKACDPDRTMKREPTGPLSDAQTRFASAASLSSLALMSASASTPTITEPLKTPKLERRSKSASEETAPTWTEVVPTLPFSASASASDSQQQFVAPSTASSSNAQQRETVERPPEAAEAQPYSIRRLGLFRKLPQNMQPVKQLSAHKYFENKSSLPASPFNLVDDDTIDDLLKHPNYERASMQFGDVTKYSVPVVLSYAKFGDLLVAVLDGGEAVAGAFVSLELVGKDLYVVLLVGAPVQQGFRKLRISYPGLAGRPLFEIDATLQDSNKQTICIDSNVSPTSASRLEWNGRVISMDFVKGYAYLESVDISQACRIKAVPCGELTVLQGNALTDRNGDIDFLGQLQNLGKVVQMAHQTHREVVLNSGRVQELCTDGVTSPVLPAGYCDTNTSKMQLIGAIEAMLCSRGSVPSSLCNQISMTYCKKVLLKVQRTDPEILVQLSETSCPEDVVIKELVPVIKLRQSLVQRLTGDLLHATSTAEKRKSQGLVHGGQSSLDNVVTGLEARGARMQSSDTPQHSQTTSKHNESSGLSRSDTISQPRLFAAAVGYKTVSSHFSALSRATSTLHKIQSTPLSTRAVQPAPSLIQGALRANESGPLDQFATELMNANYEKRKYRRSEGVVVQRSREHDQIHKYFNKFPSDTYSQCPEPPLKVGLLVTSDDSSSEHDLQHLLAIARDVNTAEYFTWTKRYVDGVDMYSDAKFVRPVQSTGEDLTFEGEDGHRVFCGDLASRSSITNPNSTDVVVLSAFKGSAIVAFALEADNVSFLRTETKTLTLKRPGPQGYYSHKSLPHNEHGERPQEGDPH